MSGPAVIIQSRPRTEERSGGAGGGGNDPNRPRKLPSSHAKDATTSPAEVGTWHLLRILRYSLLTVHTARALTKAYLRELEQKRRSQRKSGSGVVFESEVMARDVRSDRTLQFRDERKATTATLDMKRADYLVPMGGHVRADYQHNGDAACVTCRNGRGPFAHCRTLDGGIFHGACTNCAWGNHGARCTFYVARTSHHKPV